MSTLSSLFGWSSGGPAASELPNIFPLAVAELLFVETDTQSIYAKILTDVIERTNGLSEKHQPLLWDNCLKSEAGDGLITLIAKAMTAKADLFIVFDQATSVIRKATANEQAKIKADYEAQAKSATGIFISFKNYVKTDMVKLYAALEYCSVASLHKSMNLSKAVQIKIHELRSTTALADKADAKAQAQAMAEHLAKGKDIMLDAKDSIETSTPSLEPVKNSILFLNQKRAFYLGLPASYVTGELTGGLGDTGEADKSAVERGLRPYYFSVIKPVIESLFGSTTTFKSKDVRSINSALESIKTFELVSEDLITMEEKRMIIAMQLDLPQVMPKSKLAKEPDDEQSQRPQKSSSESSQPNDERQGKVS